jgi:hypothetical protein
MIIVKTPQVVQNVVDDFVERHFATLRSIIMSRINVTFMDMICSLLIMFIRQAASIIRLIFAAIRRRNNAN